MPTGPTRGSMTLAQQICQQIPPHLVGKLTRKHGIDARSFSSWSHVTAHICGQVTRAIGLNDICDSLEINSSSLRAIRGATPPKRNTFSHANRTRSSKMPEELYWSMVTHLSALNPSFGKGKIRSGYLRRFKSRIHAVDSTTIQLVANCLDWAKHRRRKAAAKCHLSLNLQTMLPSYAVVDIGKSADNATAWAVCSHLRDGEIVVFDKAYVDFAHLGSLDERGVCWVTRAKSNMLYHVIQENEVDPKSRVDRDQIVELADYMTKKKWQGQMRLVKATVEVDGKETQLEFLTNNFHWSPWTVAELYRARWEIEVFFKEVKQTVQLVDFIGYNKNAVEWQIWMALLTHLLMRFFAHLSKWRYSFTRMFSLTRASLWHRYDILDLLTSYGTAGGLVRMRACPQHAYLPGFGVLDAFPMGQPKRRKPRQSKHYEKSMQSRR